MKRRKSYTIGRGRYSISSPHDLHEDLGSLIHDVESGKTNSSDHDTSTGVTVEENRVYFYTEVTEASVLELNRALRLLDVELQCLSLRFNTSFMFPIDLHIHSDGGNLFSGLAAVDTIRSLKCNVNTYIDGSAASAATLMSVAGAKRYMYKNSFMLIHQLSSMISEGTHEQFKDEMENQKVLMDRIKAVYRETTTLDEETLEDILKRDLWFDSDRCLELGLVDEVL